jgi:hypothetical protein
MKTDLTLKPYVAETPDRNESPLSRLGEVCERELAGTYQIAVVDIRVEREVSEQAKMVVPPTMIQEASDPALPVEGDLTDMKRILIELDLPSHRKYA